MTEYTQVPFKGIIEEVEEGKRYRVWLEMPGKFLRFQVCSRVPIPDVIKREQLKAYSANEGRKIFQMILIKGDDERLILEGREYDLLFGCVVKAVISFYFSMEILRASTTGKVAQFSELKGKAVLVPEACEILRSPKFGCAL